MRKFEVIDVEGDMSGPGPARLWKIRYRAIVNKQWVDKWLWITARNAREAKKKAEGRFGEVSF